MTCAVAEAIMNCGQKCDFIDAMKKYGKMYPDAGYGARSSNWVEDNDREPYNSFGNGSAILVSPCAWVIDCGFCERTGIWPLVEILRVFLQRRLIIIQKVLRELW